MFAERVFLLRAAYIAPGNARECGTIERDPIFRRKYNFNGEIFLFREMQLLLGLKQREALRRAATPLSWIRSTRGFIFVSPICLGALSGSRVVNLVHCGAYYTRTIDNARARAYSRDKYQSARAARGACSVLKIPFSRDALNSI